MKSQDLHILLIEDKDADAKTVDYALYDMGFILSRMNYLDLAIVRLALKSADRVDAILVGIDLVDDQGLDQLQILCSRRPDLPVLVVGDIDEDMLMRAIAVGAHGYVEHSEMWRLPRAIHIAVSRKARLSNGHARDYQEDQDVDQTGEWNIAVLALQSCTTQLESMTQGITISESKVGSKE